MNSKKTNQPNLLYTMVKLDVYTSKYIAEYSLPEVDYCFKVLANELINRIKISPSKQFYSFNHYDTDYMYHILKSSEETPFFLCLTTKTDPRRVEKFLRVVERTYLSLMVLNKERFEKFIKEQMGAFEQERLSSLDKNQLVDEEMIELTEIDIENTRN